MALTATEIKNLKPKNKPSTAPGFFNSTGRWVDYPDWLRAGANVAPIARIRA